MSDPGELERYSRDVDYNDNREEKATKSAKYHRGMEAEHDEFIGNEEDEKGRVAHERAAYHHNAAASHYEKAVRYHKRGSHERAEYHEKLAKDHGQIANKESKKVSSDLKSAKSAREEADEQLPHEKE